MFKPLLQSWNFARLAIVLSALLLSHTALAVNITDLYRVHVLVEDRSQETLNAGISQAFQQLIVKISGSQQPLTTPEVISAARNAKSYMQGYSYKQVERLDPNSRQMVEQPMLEVWFSKPLVAKVLRKGKVPIWSSNRPLLQLWLYHGRTLIAPKDEQTTQYTFWQTGLEQVFEDHGLPVKWSQPLANVANSVAASSTATPAKVDLATVVATDFKTVREATKQQKSDAAVIAEINRSAAGWQMEANLVEANSNLFIQAQGDSLESVLHQLAVQIAQYYSQQFAVVTGTAENIQLIKVEQVADFEAYAGCLKYLQKLAGVKRVDVLEVKDGQVFLALVLNSSWQQILRVINLDKKLQQMIVPQPALDTTESEAAQQELNITYRWQG